jgi:predicted metal-dependent hydrolase
MEDAPRDRYGRPLAEGSPDELLRDDEPRSTDEAVERAVERFDGERFFEAHELFELVWKSKDTDPSERTFWKAVTQVAVGCCHLQRGNAAGAIALLRRAASHLDARTLRRVDGAELRRRALDLAATIERGATASTRVFFRFPRR